MLLINSIKIMFSNLSTMWKVLLYKLITLLIFIGFLAAVVLPQVIGLINAIVGTGLVTNFKAVISEVLSISLSTGEKVAAFNTSLLDTLEILANNGVSFVLVYISTFVVFCLYKFINTLLDLPLTAVLESNLNSCAKMPVLTTFFKNFKRSAKYSAFSLLITLPSTILFIVAILFLSQVLISWLGILALFFIVILIVIFFAFNSTVFSMWRPAIVVDDHQTLPAFKTSLSVVFKNFGLLYSYYIIIYFAQIFLNLIVAFFTCGAGLIISIPLSIVLMSIFQLVFYFSFKRKKYYVDGDTIIDARLDHTMPDLEAPEVLENNETLIED